MPRNSTHRYTERFNQFNGLQNMLKVTSWCCLTQLIVYMNLDKQKLMNISLRISFLINHQKYTYLQKVQINTTYEVQSLQILFTIAELFNLFPMKSVTKPKFSFLRECWRYVNRTGKITIGKNYKGLQSKKETELFLQTKFQPNSSLKTSIFLNQAMMNCPTTSTMI